MKLTSLFTAILALSLSTGVVEEAAAQQGNRSRTRTQTTTTKKTSIRHSTKPRPASVSQAPIVPVETPSNDPKVSMPLVPEPQRNVPRVQIVPAQPPGTVPQPPVPPHPSEMPQQQR